MITGVDHVQLAAPEGSEPLLRAYYTGVLGMSELTKPPVLAGRGGCWFSAGTAVLHLGVEEDFRPARKAHPGIRVTGIHGFARQLKAKGATVVWDYDLPGHERFYSEDPVGNRLEFLEPLATRN
ncbi:glyoxalase [Streptomyces sp. V4-01]|uniref:Glyoxalase n=1 Tax=Actinacidiphila polyblastidii TaxID=3110430 RepID=A0ABU7PET9_9ACTN|nr:glyoxalase [Streptomyces sp. V4-01]